MLRITISKLKTSFLKCHFDERMIVAQAIIGMALVQGFIGAAFGENISGTDYPVVLVLPDSTEFKDGEKFGLVGYFIDRATEKRTKAQVAEVHKSIDRDEITDSASQTFACIGMAPQEKCRDLRVIGKNDDTAELVRRMAWPGAIEVRLITILTDHKYWARASVVEFNSGNGKVKVGRRYGASYESRIPSDVITSAGTDITVLQRYWTGGDQPRLRNEVLNSFVELRDMLTWMTKEAPARGASKAWKDLPNLIKLREEGRVTCKGASCSSLHFVSSSGSRLWFVNEQPFGELGPIITSVDEYAARSGSFIANIAQGWGP